MVFTIGNTKIYEQGLKRVRDGASVEFAKLGKSETYIGGIVFKTEDDAIEYLTKDIENEVGFSDRDNNYSIFQVDADWSNDCYHLVETKDKYWKYLLRSKPIVSIA